MPALCVFMYCTTCGFRQLFVDQIAETLKFKGQVVASGQ